LFLFVRNLLALIQKNDVLLAEAARAVLQTHPQNDIAA
jgi:hypothetical protein